MLSPTNSSSENTNQLTVVYKKRQKIVSELAPLGLSPGEIFSQKRILRKRANINYDLRRRDSLSEIEDIPKKRKYKKKRKTLKSSKQHCLDNFDCYSNSIQSSSSEYKFIRTKRKRKIKTISQGGKTKIKYETTNVATERKFSLKSFLDLRKLQIEGLLTWKDKNNNIQSNSNEYITYTVDSITNIKDMKDYLGLINNQLHAILVNPPWNNEGYSFEHFKQINLPLCAMESGIIFIWTKKDLLYDMITYIEGLENENTIKYVENLVWIKLSKKQLDNDAYQGESKYYNLDSIFHQGKSQFLSNSHMTLLFFRKEKKENDHLELRHQRTNDVVFDYMDEDDNINYTPSKFVYKMIETLLPKASFRGNEGERMKLLEIFSTEKEGRKGWIHLKERK